MVKLFRGIRPFKPTALVHDAIAGITLAAMNIPQVLGYTKIAGMPVVTGLYALMLPLVGFAIFGSSRLLLVSADSATAAIFAGGAAALAVPSSERYIALAGAVALLTAAFLLIARMFKLGFIADFLSQTVLLGFLTGVGFQVGIAVLGGMLGLQISARRTVLQAAEIVKQLPHVHLPTAALSAVVVALLLLLRRFAPKLPAPLIVVAGTIAASMAWNFGGRGIAIIGPVARGLPHIGFRAVAWGDLPALLTIAASCTIMIITQSAATARAYGNPRVEPLDENGDLGGLSAANALAGLSGTFVVNGSPTQTAMAVSVDSQSQFTQLVTAGTVAIVLLFLTRPLEYLPRCVLGALVFLIAIRLIKLRSLIGLRLESPGEYFLALTTAIVVVGVGVEQGIVLAMILSVVRIVRHSYHPHTGVMSVAPDDTWKLTPVAAGVTTEPGIILYRFGANLFYANANLFADEVRCLVGSSPSLVRWFIVDAEAITRLDYSAARVLQELETELRNSSVALGFARMPWDLKSDFKRHHVIDGVDPGMIFNRLHDSLRAFAESKAPARTKSVDSTPGADPSSSPQTGI